MKQISIGKFKARCLSLMDQVSRTGESIVITKRGKPLVKVVAVDRPEDDIFGYMAGKVRIVGDVVGTITPTDDWNHK